MNQFLQNVGKWLEANPKYETVFLNLLQNPQFVQLGLALVNLVATEFSQVPSQNKTASN